MRDNCIHDIYPAKKLKAQGILVEKNGVNTVLLTAWFIEKRWTSAAMLLAFVISLKPTFAVFFLLAVALYRPLWWRVPPILFGFLMIPVLVGGWHYGSEQYLNFIAMGKSAMELGMEEANWATFFNIAPQLF